MAEFVVKQATSVDFERMESWLARAEAATAVERLEIKDNALHEAIVAAMHNQFLIGIYERVALQRRRAEWGKLKERSLTLQCRLIYQREHRLMVAALRARDQRRRGPRCSTISAMSVATCSRSERLSGSIEARLYVCETCVRDLAIGAEEKTRGRQLADALVEKLRALAPGAQIVYRTVLCLNGCPSPCNIALRALGKWSLRLGRLTPADAEPIVDLLLAYSSSHDGNIPPERWPTTLRDKVTARAPPPGPRS